MKRIFPIIIVIGLLASSCAKEITGVTLSPEAVELEVGEQIALKATVTPKTANTKGLTFSSSEPSVATVSPDGVVNAIAAGNTVVTVTTDDGNYKAHCSVAVVIQATLSAELFGVSAISATIAGKLTVKTKGDFTKSAVLYYSDAATTLEELKATGKKKNISLNDNETYTIFVDGFTYNAMNYCCVVAKVDGVEFASSVISVKTKAFPDGAVDLGLSVKWASANLGASTPFDYGRHFAFGDVSGQTWNGSSWSDGGFSLYPSYELYDDSASLKFKYDAANVILGEDWRMPLENELQELIDDCVSTYTTINGVKGVVFTSRKPGFTDMSIFLPAGGEGKNVNFTDAGTNGYYWSATFDETSSTRAYYLALTSGAVSVKSIVGNRGLSVRPVLRW